MYKIQTNLSGSRSIAIEEQHLQTIHRFRLLDNLVGSNGVVDETVLNKLRYNVRSLLGSEYGNEKALLDLCLDVIYHANMKPYGLNSLMRLYEKWRNALPEASMTEECH
ncbi:hypothetical protein [Bacteroides heparinolyticus]|uniref:hypothetical protein n=1 Tax=Prevotella heparinolytica TaxID=28113 RepID=UPI002A9D2ABF|nr:hypothetical protein [Prevotella sp.]